MDEQTNKQTNNIHKITFKLDMRHALPAYLLASQSNASHFLPIICINSIMNSMNALLIYHYLLSQGFLSSQPRR